MPSTKIKIECQIEQFDGQNFVIDVHKTFSLEISDQCTSKETQEYLAYAFTGLLAALQKEINANPSNDT